jgi:hypothetical protein
LAIGSLYELYGSYCTGGEGKRKTDATLVQLLYFNSVNSHVLHFCITVTKAWHIGFFTFSFHFNFQILNNHHKQNGIVKKKPLAVSSGFFYTFMSSSSPQTVQKLSKSSQIPASLFFYQWSFKGIVSRDEYFFYFFKAYNKK